MNTEDAPMPPETEDEREAAYQAKIKELLGPDDVDEVEDPGGFGSQPLEKTPVSERIDMDAGQDLIEQARDARGRFQKTIDEGADTTEGADTAASASGKDTVAAAAAPDPANAAVTDTSTIDDLISGLDDEKKTAIRQRVSAADDIMALFKPHEEEMKMHGIDARAGMSRLLQLNKFAQEKPDEYLAWVAQRTGGENPAKVFSDAAARLGLKVVAEDDDGEFDDPEIKRLREENRQLKRQAEPDFGPDAPQYRAQATVADIIASVEHERDASGKPVRPHFDMLRSQIASRATAQRAETGQPPGAEDLKRFYAEEEAKFRAAFGGGNFAAQPAPKVTEPKQKDAAAPRPASKMLDGAGQGADRRPAYRSGSIRDDIKAAIAKLSDA